MQALVEVMNVTRAQGVRLKLVKFLSKQASPVISIELALDFAIESITFR